ncbi:MAG TPA: molybdopterin-dependent oxidoreductase [Candidatus Sulfotelmatobacter sp.]|nr:molybdopterin-dependent oxidoreductase [Candidatus Sulfotelmatobacter sp.]
MSIGRKAFNLSRRGFLRSALLAGAGGVLVPWSSLADETIMMPFANGERRLVTYPQKKPLILLTSRPPQLETPFSVFNKGILTPNDEFFVRYHLAGIPTSIDTDKFRVDVKGSVHSPLSLSLKDLKTQFEQVDLVAVIQCSGNGRAFFQPRVPGGQSGNGTMGNARWKGVRLADILNKAGVGAEAQQVSFRGLDKPVLDTTPAFGKALDIDHAMDGEVMVAYEMNGEDLPMLNGFPLRLVVPGCYGTYWVKQVHEITVLDQHFASFWMDTAYRVPDNDCECVPPGSPAGKTRPIGRYDVRSFITSLADGEKITVGKPVRVRGIAFDGGAGIETVEFSSDGGSTWTETTLGKDYGNYSFREWTFHFTPRTAGDYSLQCCAVNHKGETQPREPRWNPSGYMRNVIETVRVSAV